MNKTIQINLAKQIFHVDEIAYNQLHTYVEKLRQHFIKENDGDEIMADIESRLAEIFLSLLNNKNEVISQSEVDHAINLLGKAEDVINESETDTTKNADKKNQNNNNNSTKNEQTYTGPKILYRDDENKVLAGVCSGLSHYFGVSDPIWFRLTFVISLFAFGWGVVLYLILAVVMPKAITNLDRMRMKGNPITISEIEKNIKSDIDDFNTKYGSINSTGNQIIGIIGSIFTLFGQIVLFIFKGIGVFFGILILVVLCALLFGFNQVIFSDFSFSEFADGETAWANLGIVAAFFVILIPILALGIGIIKNLFKININHKYLYTSALAIWLLAVLMSLFAITQFSKIMRTSQTVQVNKSLYPMSSDTLNIRMDAVSELTENMGVVINGNKYAFINDTIIYKNIKFDIEKSNTDSMYIEIHKTARGRDRNKAFANATQLEYEFLQNDTLITLNPYFNVYPNEKFRGQSIRITLMLPIGKTIYIDKSLFDILDDVKNTSNTYDGDMLDKYWTMTPLGLTNQVALTQYQENQKKQKEEENDEDNNIIINSDDKAIKIMNGEDVIIKIDSTGLQIKQKSNTK